MMTLCCTERASSVRWLRRPRMNTPQLCHCRPPPPPPSSAPPLLRGPLHPRLCGSQTHTCPTSRRGSAAGCHLNAIDPVESVHVLGDAADAVPQLLQYGDRRPSSGPPSWTPRRLKGLLDTVLYPLKLQRALPLNGAHPPRDLTFGWQWMWLPWTSASEQGAPV